MDVAYGYCNARVKAMETRLLPEAVLRELRVVKSLAEVVQILEQSSYKEAFVEASRQYSGIALVLQGLQNDFVATLEKMRKMLPEKAGLFFDALALEWEVQDLKEIITKKALNKQVSSSDLVLYSPRGVSFAEKALNANTLEKTLDLVEAKYDISEARKAFVETKDFRLLLDGLDRVYYARLNEMILKLPEEKTRHLLSYRLFLKNALLVLRMKKTGLAEDVIRKNLVPSVSHSAILTRMLAAEDFLAALSVLDNAKSLGLVKAWNDGNKLWEVELLIEKHFFEKARKTLRIEVLSFGVIVSYLFLKTIEVDNIKKIALGKHFGIEELMNKHMVA